MSVTPSGLQRRTLTVSGHRTSVALEPVFWRQLAAIAESRNLSVAAVITEIDSGRAGNLASAIRVHIVERLLAASASRG